MVSCVSLIEHFGADRVEKSFRATHAGMGNGLVGCGAVGMILIRSSPVHLDCVVDKALHGARHGSDQSKDEDDAEFMNSDE
jgi:hypothetical protein